MPLIELINIIVRVQQFTYPVRVMERCRSVQVMCTIVFEVPVQICCVVPIEHYWAVLKRAQWYFNLRPRLDDREGA
jgi:hypothetical protein